MVGQTVIVRDFMGEPLVRRVWSASKSKVYICTDDTFTRLKSGSRNLSPIGFPRNDVFFYDAGLLKEVTRNYRHNPEVWRKLKVWNETS